MSSDEELDYMSDRFLSELEGNDLRPGLIHDHSEQRKHHILKKKALADEKNKTRFRPYSVLEKEKRDEGLQKALSSDNKGFAILQKMGYKPGSGIGKSGTGSITPVNIELKTDRKGLGRKEAVEMLEARKRTIREKIAQNHMKPHDIDEYQMRKSRECAEKQVIADMKLSQRICFDLDNREGFDEPVESWFWPENMLKELCEDSVSNDGKENTSSEEQRSSDSEEDSEDTIGFQPSDKLELLTLYLRKEYFFCIWCGTRFEDFGNLEEYCPGPTRADH